MTSSHNKIKSTHRTYIDSTWWGKLSLNNELNATKLQFVSIT